MKRWIALLLLWWVTLGLAVHTARAERFFKQPLTGSVNQQVRLDNNKPAPIGSSAMNANVRHQPYMLVQGTIRLGDNSYDDWSSHSDGLGDEQTQPYWENTFNCTPQLCDGFNANYLILGTVTGVDTEAEHLATQSPNPYHASSARVLVDGHPVNLIQRNGERIELRLNNLSRGLHTLRIEPGWHIDSTGRRDLDDMAITGGIWLE
jgi:hypothetical protein